jgi:hypothetical protein
MGTIQIRGSKPGVLALALFAVTSSSSGIALAAIPHQFIAKSYTEGLGRMPDQTGWQDAVNNFNSNGCSQPTLKAWGRTVYLSGEYSAIGYDNSSRVLTLYRGILNREPDSAGFNNWRNTLNGGAVFSAVVDTFFDSSEFAALVSPICNQDGYSFGGAPPIALPIATAGFVGTQAQVQNRLNFLPPGGTLVLAQRALVGLTSTLVIPAGRTLKTFGGPNHGQYANMARLVRGTAFDGPMVQLHSGARLVNIWVDGARGAVGDNRNALSVQLLGGTNTTVSQSVISNTSGWSSLQAFGTAEGWPCASNTISDNLITAYSSSHTGFTFTDGLSIGCENTTAEFNQIVDATDVHIVLFRAGTAVQQSQVRSNFVLAAGNSAFGAIGLDPLAGEQTGYDFTGSSVNNNTLWSGKGRFDIGLAIGTRPWFTNNNWGIGASVTNNTTGSQHVLCDVCISVSGMFDVTVQGNSFLSTLTDSSPCPIPGQPPASIDVAASTPDGWASGSIQAFTPLSLAQCISAQP